MPPATHTHGSPRSPGIARAKREHGVVAFKWCLCEDIEIHQRAEESPKGLERTSAGTSIRNTAARAAPRGPWKRSRWRGQSERIRALEARTTTWLRVAVVQQVILVGLLASAYTSRGKW